MAKENTVLVGNKDFMNYMRSLELLFRKQNKREVTLIARGQNMKKAIDISEASKNKFLSDLNISTKNVSISTIKFDDNDGIERSVSSITIKLVRS